MTIAGYDDSITIGEMFKFLDDLRDSGRTNMYGAGPFVMEEFGLSRREAGEVVQAWMKTFNADETPEDRAVEALDGVRT